MSKYYQEKPLCSYCNGTGIGYYYNHGYGEDSVEPIRCDKCEGVGFIHTTELYEMPIIEVNEEYIKLCKEWDSNKHLGDPEVKKFYEEITKENAK